MNLTRRQILQRAIAGLSVASAPKACDIIPHVSEGARFFKNHYWSPILTIDPAFPGGDRTCMAFGRYMPDGTFHIERFQHASLGV